MATEVKATLRYLRMSPRKVRLVTDLIKGHKATIALARLMTQNKEAAHPIGKLLKSAIANAKHNFSFPVEQLRVINVIVNNGPMLKRWMPKARGRATPVRERTAHIHLTLLAEEPLEQKAKVVKKVKKQAK